jgi:hypothetical protein
VKLRNIPTKFDNNQTIGFREEVENSKNAQKLIKKLKKIAAPPAEQIKV